MTRRLTVLTSICACALTPATAHADTFMSLMGVGQGKGATLADFSAQTATGAPPAAFVSQLDMFNALLPTGATMDDRELPRYFKPAPLDPPPGSVLEQPREGVTIARDQFNVPYVTGATREAMMWGSGYAQAQDRLFFMDVLRHVAEGRSTELIGPGEDAVNVKRDLEQLRVADYSDAELHAMLDRSAAASPEGLQVVRDIAAYTAGINAFIARARRDASVQPVEYGLLAKPLEDWRAIDSVAVTSLLNGSFGIGGGGELKAAGVLHAARARFGARRGRKVFADFRRIDDPEAPVVVTKRFPFDDPGRPRTAAVALPDSGSITHDDDVSAPPAAAGGLLARGLGLKRHASNAMVIDAKHATGGHPLLVAGPQVGFYAPAIVSEIVLRGPGIAVRGPAIPGAGTYPIAGRGRGYAWSVTTAQGDTNDIFAERLCEPDGRTPTLESAHYIRGQRCIALSSQRRTLSWSPGPADLLQGGRVEPYTTTLHVQRSVHGPIVARGTVDGAPVAFARARASYRQELQAGIGLSRLIDGVDGPRDFQRSISIVSGSYNWFYADDAHTAYVQSGRYPRRARGTDPSFPTWGDGRFDWRGFDPETNDAQILGFKRLPQAIDPKRGYLVSWNQKQAPGWRSSDADWQYGSVHRSQRLERRVRTALKGGRIGLGQLAAIMGDAGTVDLRGQEVLPWLLRVIGDAPPPAIAPAVAKLREWVTSGSHRRDADGDGAYDHSAAVALMDVWWEPLVRAIYEPGLGPDLFKRITDVIQIDYLPKDGHHTFFYGWYGYVQKDLRTLLGRRVRGPFSRRYCGSGRLGACRATLTATLQDAVQAVGDIDTVRVSPTCPEETPQRCDQLQFTAAGATTVPPVPWQDRGTFQQVVQVTSRRGESATPTR